MLVPPEPAKQPLHTRPEWANEAQLRRVLLLPALRYVHIVRAFYLQRKQISEIARETGFTWFAVQGILARVRQAAVRIGYDITPHVAEGWGPTRCEGREFHQGGLLRAPRGTKGRRLLDSEPILAPVSVAQMPAAGRMQ